MINSRRRSLRSGSMSEDDLAKMRVQSGNGTLTARDKAILLKVNYHFG